MSDLAVAGAIDRSGLTLPDLQLMVAGKCQIVSYRPPGRVKVREWAKSPTVIGGVQLSSKADVDAVVLVLRILGSTKSALDTNLTEYMTAFDQDDFTVSIQLAGGTAVVWSCNDAEWAPIDEEVNKFQLMAAPLRQTYQFTIPAQPLPLSGVL
jgi:hypothetical protein